MQLCEEELFCKKYKIKSYEVNANNEMKPYVLLHYLEDVAYNDAENRNFGYTALYPQGCGWFVTKYHLKFEKLPSAWDNIEIKTWPVHLTGIQCRRDFEIRNEENSVIGVGASLWVIVDFETKRILKPLKVFDSMPGYERMALDSNFSKIEPIQNVDYKKIFQVRYDDIDLNGHVNNSNYIAWATETMPYDFLNCNLVSEIEISYKKETRYGMEILSEVQYNHEDNSTLHVLKNNESGEELVNIKIIWKNK